MEILYKGKSLDVNGRFVVSVKEIKTLEHRFLGA